MERKGANMTTRILNSETAQLPIDHLLKQLEEGGGVAVRNADGKIVAVVLSGADQEALAYAEAKQDSDQNREKGRKALERRGGITTAELLAKAAAAAEKAAHH